MIYFISGHRDLSYDDFKKYYIPAIDDVALADEDPSFVVGDCEGVDKFAMDYIAKTYPWIPMTIFHMFEYPRNTPLNLSEKELDENSAHYEYKSIPEVCFCGGYKSDEERDAAMTERSHADIAFIKDNRWSSGTAKNIKRRHNISNNGTK